MKEIKLFTEYNSEKDQYEKLYEVSQNELDGIKRKINFKLNHKGSVVNTQKSYSCKGIRLMLNNLLK